jgi:hypothetical protein
MGPEVHNTNRQGWLRRFRVPVGLHPIHPQKAQPKLIGWRMAIHEIRALLLTITVRAFVRCRTTMPSADFCRPVRRNHSPLSPDSGTNGRSPEVSSTAFRAQPPDLQPVPLMDTDFAVSCPLVRHRMPHIRFLFIGSRLCSAFPSDPASRRRPCASLTLHLHQVE